MILYIFFGILVVAFTLFSFTMRYVTYKSPSTMEQGKASSFEKKIFNIIDRILN